MGDRTRGIYEKFIVRRADNTDAPGQKHAGCEYFVLDMTHDPLAIPALRAYAEAASEAGYGHLAVDITNRIIDIESRRALQSMKE